VIALKRAPVGMETRRGAGHDTGASAHGKRRADPRANGNRYDKEDSVQKSRQSSDSVRTKSDHGVRDAADGLQLVTSNGLTFGRHAILLG
jgi:hypothetical protein